jgi:hypothetical protein
MGFAGVVFALFTVGYILGVWTAMTVLRQPQQSYEDAVPASLSDVPIILLRDTSHVGTRRP